MSISRTKDDAAIPATKEGDPPLPEVPPVAVKPPAGSKDDGAIPVTKEGGPPLSEVPHVAIKPPTIEMSNEARLLLQDHLNTIWARHCLFSGLMAKHWVVLQAIIRKDIFLEQKQSLESEWEQVDNLLIETAREFGVPVRGDPVYGLGSTPLRFGQEGKMHTGQPPAGTGAPSEDPIYGLGSQYRSWSSPTRPGAPSARADGLFNAPHYPSFRNDRRFFSARISAPSAGTDALSAGTGAPSAGTGAPSAGPSAPSAGPSAPSAGPSAPSSRTGAGLRSKSLDWRSCTGPGALSARSDTPFFQSGTPYSGYGTRASSFGTGTPSFGTGTPSFGTGTPSFGTGTPSFGTGTPSLVIGTPSVGTGLFAPGLGSHHSTSGLSMGPGSFSTTSGSQAASPGAIHTMHPPPIPTGASTTFGALPHRTREKPLDLAKASTNTKEVPDEDQVAITMGSLSLLDQEDEEDENDTATEYVGDVDVPEEDEEDSGSDASTVRPARRPVEASYAYEDYDYNDDNDGGRRKKARKDDTGPGTE